LRRRSTNKDNSVVTVLVNRFTSEEATYVVVCEETLVNKELEKGFFVDPRYFGGIQTDMDNALITAKEADYATLLGNSVVKRAISLGICSPLSIKRIGKIMYAEVARV